LNLRDHNRHDYIRFRDQVVPRPFEPAGKSRHEIMPVGALQRQDRLAARFIVTHDRTRAVERGRFGETTGAACACADIEVERQTATRTHRSFEENDFLPAIGTKIARIAHQRAARHAKRRI
jgi:hypothetical protein